MKKGFITALSAIVALLTTATFSAATEDKSLRERLSYSRVVEAVIWSLSLMNFKVMRDCHKEFAGLDYDDVAYNSKVQDWRLQMTTPNNTTPYVMPFWDAKGGSVTNR